MRRQKIGEAGETMVEKGVVLTFVGELLQRWLMRYQARRECGVTPRPAAVPSAVQPYRAGSHGERSQHQPYGAMKLRGVTGASDHCTAL